MLSGLLATGCATTPTHQTLAPAYRAYEARIAAEEYDDALHRAAQKCEMDIPGWCDAYEYELSHHPSRKYFVATAPY